MSLPRLTLFEAGASQALDALAHRGGSLRHIRFPAMFALIEHPTAGPILFDTGYSHRFEEETRVLPAKLYALITRVTVTDDELAVARLARRGLQPSDVRTVVISHFHADHIGAIAMFPRAKYRFTRAAWDGVRHLRGVRAVAAAFLPGLLPADFDERAQPIDADPEVNLPSELAPFRRGIDLVGDGTVVAVSLPGHAHGQIGLVVRHEGGLTFLVADACFTSRAFTEGVLPSRITKILHPDQREYEATIERIGAVYRSAPDVFIVPSHCTEALARHGTP